MRGYAKFMKELVINKCVIDVENIEVTHNCITTMSSIMVAKTKDLGAFIIPYTIRVHKFEKTYVIFGQTLI